MVAFAADLVRLVFKAEWPLDRNLAGDQRQGHVALVVELRAIVAMYPNFAATIKSAKLIYTLATTLESVVFTAMVIEAIILEAINATI